jgi:threonine/homoserine/homoserine lactone efflux protein
MATWRVAERETYALGDEREPGLGFQGVIDTSENLVDCRNPRTERGIPDDRLVDGGSAELAAEDTGLEVEHALGEPVARRGSAIVDDTWWKDRHHRAIRAPGMPVEVVSHAAVVDDEQGPGVVGVRRIGVIDEASVKDLPKPRNRRAPGANQVALLTVHDRIVQDGHPIADDPWLVETLAALVGFSFVSSVTPGPNNVLLWASGVQFGFRSTIPHVLGTSLGIGAMAVAGSAGVGLLITALPQADYVLKAIGSLYLLYLAFRIAGSPAMNQTEVGRPLGLAQAAALQWVNPKAWIFVVAAVTAYRPADFDVAVGSALVVLTMMIVVIPSAAIWAAGGSALNQFVASERAHRLVSVGLAAVLAVTVVYIWI